MKGKISFYKNQLNKKMEGKYSPHYIALTVAVLASVLMLMMLFLPPYLGVADDGSLEEIMSRAGISYVQSEEETESDVYFNYFIKTYSTGENGSIYSKGMITSHIYLIRLAKWLDHLFTGDNFFDIRFLGLIYGILYIPAIYLFIKQACMQVTRFSEGLLIGIVGLLMFSDVAYITYFNSFYPEAVWLISLMYCVAAAISFQTKRSRKRDMIYLLLLLVSAVVFTASKKQCAVIGLLFTFFCLKLALLRKDWSFKISCVLAGFILTIVSFSYMFGTKSDFTQTSKFHAMTRGVLFVADDPAETLKEFGISSSYEILTDVSAYEELPFVDGEDEILQNGFLDQYHTADIAVYYLKHPGKFMNMVDIAIKSCFGIRRDFCGNYQMEVGLPKGAKSTFWSLWSKTKTQSMPKTIGGLAVLLVVSCVLFGKGYSFRPRKMKQENVMLDGMIMLGILCFLQAGITIIHSGDAEMVRHCFPISCSMDMMTYFVFTGIVHKTNIF